MTNLYLDYGTYTKSFYSIMTNPSAVSLMKLGDVHKRIHHKIEWNSVVPKLINQKYQK